ncbi:ORF68 [Retroperitoneal fibromatosis-associated herpesvirus]|uniref:Packaging protein UL32 n=1 Tax=Retroperitoneal fibromatosis-associated herpesvirus TaxID=111469 RepID=U5NIH5_9GAMA|nr:ORF68 [Retroperitoneal fibromatosis-associated herpesvirus]AGY30755.1 ORF68 [Retroperitoneal fibromatosis-associated herpesvirus]
MFVPWQLETIQRHRNALEKLLAASFLPDRPEESLGDPLMTQTHESLQPSSSCRICKLLFSLARNASTPVEFFEDYACVCLCCLYAPNCWTATVAVAADLCELLVRHFPTHDDSRPLFGHGNILGVDLQLHFFIQKCFRTTPPEKLIGASNLQFIKLEVLRGLLTGAIGTSFCFKTSWPRTDREEPPTNTPCCNATEVLTAGQRRLPREIDDAFGSAALPQKPNLLRLFLRTWPEAAGIHDENSLLEPLDAASFDHMLPQCTPPPDADGAQGPCLLHPTLGLRYKNGTSSVCILCECLAAHPEAPAALLALQREVLQNIENNVKLVDRIAFVLEGPNALPYVSDPLLRCVLLHRDPREIHRHLFCDPLCAINAKAVCERILFNTPSEPEYKKLRALVASGHLLDTNARFDCESLQSLAFLAKALQHCRVGKTTACEIIRELAGQLRKHGLDLTHPAQTVQTYA